MTRSPNLANIRRELSGSSDAEFLAILARSPDFTKSEQRIVEYVIYHKDLIPKLTIAMIVKNARVSEATVNRFCKKLNCEGIKELKVILQKEMAPSLDLDYNNIDAHDSLRVMAGKVVAQIIDSLRDTLPFMEEDTLARCVRALHDAEQIFVFGFGNSSTICHNFETRFMRFGKPVRAFSDAHLMSTASALCKEGTLIIAISHSGSTVELVDNALVAKQNGAFVLAITGNPQSELARLADLTLLGTGRERPYRTEASASSFSYFAIVDILYTAYALSDINQYQENIRKMRAAITPYKQREH